MESHEIVQRAIEFRSPERLPLRYFFDSERSDMIQLRYGAPIDWVPQVEGEDEFGCIWKGCIWDSEGDLRYFGQVDYERSPIKSWEDYDRFQWPDPHASGRFEALKEQVEIHKSRGKYLVGDMIAVGGNQLGITGYHRLQFLRGFDNFFIDLVLNPEMIRMMIDDLVQYELGIISELLRAGVDAIWFGDDWGSQYRLLIAPELWREIFKPMYKTEFDFVHEHGGHVIVHSCGYVWDIIPDWIEIGADALNFNQVHIFETEDTSGIDRLGENFRSKVCFICPVDIQKTLIYGKTREIIREANHLVSALSTSEGGFIAACDEGKEDGYIPAASIKAATRAFEVCSHRVS